MAAVAGAPVGVLAYLTYTAARGSGFFDPLTEQSPYRGAVTDPFSRLADAVGDMVTPDRLGDAVHPPMALLMVFLTVVVVRRLPLRYAALHGPRGARVAQRRELQLPRALRPERLPAGPRPRRGDRRAED